MKKTTLTLILLILFVLSMPLAYAEAQTRAKEPPKLDYAGFVKCDGVVNKDDPAEKVRNRECNFYWLMETVKKFVNFLFYITIPIAIALFAYAGVLLMTGREGHRKTAKAVFSSVAIGFIIMATGWFAVRQVVEWFVDDPAATVLVK